METTKKKASPFLQLLRSFLLLYLCLPLLTSCEGQKIIVNDLDEKEANEILVFLSSKQIDADKKVAEPSGGGGAGKGTKWNIGVKTSEATEAMRLLNLQGLPRRKSQTILELYSTSGLVPSDQQEKIKYQAAMGETLASYIRKYDGVLDAEVVISYPLEDPLNPGKMRGKITASVWVKHSGILDDPNSHLKSQIQRSIASSITGLSYDDVTVNSERAHIVEGFGDKGVRQEEKLFVSTWGITLSVDSLFRFRIIFFSLILLLLLLSLSLIWILWKTSPLLKRLGGAKALLSIAPLGGVPRNLEEKAPPSTHPGKAVKKDESQKDGRPSKDVDET